MSIFFLSQVSKLSGLKSEKIIHSFNLQALETSKFSLFSHPLISKAELLNPYQIIG